MVSVPDVKSIPRHCESPLKAYPLLSSSGAVLPAPAPAMISMHTHSFFDLYRAKGKVGIPHCGFKRAWLTCKCISSLHIQPRHRSRGAGYHAPPPLSLGKPSLRSNDWPNAGWSWPWVLQVRSLVFCRKNRYGPSACFFEPRRWMSDRSSIGVIVAGVFPRVRKMYTEARRAWSRISPSVSACSAVSFHENWPLHQVSRTVLDVESAQLQHAYGRLCIPAYPAVFALTVDLLRGCWPPRPYGSKLVWFGALDLYLPPPRRWQDRHSSQ